MQIIIALAAGIIFGLGLLISGMSNPSKVLNFLDVFGSFDPSLLFVMAGAVGTTYFGYRWAKGFARPLFAERFHEPDPEGVDFRLIFGAVVFGVGWGLVGFCPGPVFTSLTIGGLSAFVFLAAMLIGFMVARVFGRVR